MSVCKACNGNGFISQKMNCGELYYRDCPDCAGMGEVEKKTPVYCGHFDIYPDCRHCPLHNYHGGCINGTGEVADGLSEVEKIMLFKACGGFEGYDEDVYKAANIIIAEHVKDAVAEKDKQLDKVAREKDKYRGDLQEFMAEFVKLKAEIDKLKVENKDAVADLNNVARTAQINYRKLLQRFVELETAKLKAENADAVKQERERILKTFPRAIYPVKAMQIDKCKGFDEALALCVKAVKGGGV